MPIEINKYKEAFLSEARAHVATMNASLLQLEKTPENSHLLHQISWATHTLKSSAATMNYQGMAALCHAIEDILEALKKQSMAVKSVSDLLFQCFDALESSLKRLTINAAEADLSDLVSKLNELNSVGIRDKGPGTRDQGDLKMAGDPKKVTGPGSVVSGPSSGFASASEPLASELQTEKIQAIEVKVERLDILLNLAEELIVTKMRFDRLTCHFRDGGPAALRLVAQSCIEVV